MTGFCSSGSTQAIAKSLTLNAVTAIPTVQYCSVEKSPGRAVFSECLNTASSGAVLRQLVQNCNTSGNLGHLSGGSEVSTCARSGGPGPSAERPYRRPTGREAVNPVRVRWAVSADVCGAIGCRETSGLLKVERGPEKRVLCAHHARRWLDE